MESYCHKVHYYETDKMAIVHNANYLRIFEEARLYYMEQIGVPYPEIEEAGILIPHILFMFAAMLFAVYTFLQVVTRKKYSVWLWITAATTKRRSTNSADGTT